MKLASCLVTLLLAGILTSCGSSEEEDSTAPTMASTFDTDTQTDADAPRPQLPRWLTGNGEFAFPRWDDRELFSKEERQRHPVSDPRWKPFGKCMASEGFQLTDQPGQQVQYTDLADLADELNNLNPQPEDNLAGDFADQRPDGLTQAFLDCAGPDQQARAEQDMLESAESIWRDRAERGTPVPTEIAESYDIEPAPSPDDSE